MSRPSRSALLSFIGLELNAVTHVERIVSGVGGCVGIFLVMLVTSAVLEPAPAMVIVGSMGASAVLLFGTPHGPLVQIWPSFVGHVISALIGVTCQKLFANPLVAAPLAVGVSILVMYYARCLHPPGGAAALTAVIGGPAVHELGYGFALVPVLLNTVIMVGVAVVFNYPFAWRRYPAALARRAHPRPVKTPELSPEHLGYALRQMGSLVDISEADLAEIYAIALHHARGTHMPPEDIRVGGGYANSRGNRIAPDLDAAQKLTSSAGVEAR